MKAREFVPRLFIGGRPTLADVRGKNVTFIVGVGTKPAEPEVVESYGEKYVHFPLTDGKTVDRPRFVAAAAVAATAVLRGERVLVHCREGRNRSVTVAALAAVGLRYYPTGEEALSAARVVRPNAVANPEMERFLKSIR